MNGFKVPKSNCVLGLRPQPTDGPGGVSKELIRTYLNDSKWGYLPIDAHAPTRNAHHSHAQENKTQGDERDEARLREGFSPR